MQYFKINNNFKLYFRKRYHSTNFNWLEILSKENQEKCITNLRSKRNKISFSKESEVTKFSAVLIPIVRERNNYSLLYTLRSNKLSSHARQVSFPGGKKDKIDKTYVDCALRETEEEIGLDRKNIDVWGEGQLLVTYFDSAIMPVVGVINNYTNIKLKINKEEVEKVFTTPIELLCSEKLKKHTQSRKGYSLPVFLGGDEKIWGLTALLTHQFLQSLLPSELYLSKLKYIKRIS